MAAILLAGCTADVVRWDAVKMREQVMAYYNDEIMDNLISMKEGRPFVHVDISSVSAQVLTQVSGTVGDGETGASTRTSPSVLGALGTLSKMVTRPFSYAVTPLRSDNLTMTTVPVIGPLSADNSEDGAAPAPSSTPEFEESKRKVIKGPAAQNQPEGNVIQTETESSPKLKSKPTPKAITIYSIYERFRKSIVENPNALAHIELQPSKKDIVPGTLKRHGTGYYYIRNDPVGANQAEYSRLCQSLFTQSRGKPSAGAVNAILNKAEALEAQPLSRPQ